MSADIRAERFSALTWYFRFLRRDQCLLLKSVLYAPCFNRKNVLPQLQAPDIWASISVHLPQPATECLVFLRASLVRGCGFVFLCTMLNNVRHGLSPQNSTHRL